jgi:hypothetical protein
VKLVGDAVRVVLAELLALAGHGCARPVGASDFDDLDRLLCVGVDDSYIRAPIEPSALLGKILIAADLISGAFKLLLSGSFFNSFDLEPMIRRAMRAVGIGDRLLSPSRRFGCFALCFGQVGGVFGGSCDVSEYAPVPSPTAPSITASAANAPASSS